MTRPRNQHYVPELHLKHFIGAEPKGMVWTYDNQTGTVRHSIPKETGFQRNYYSVLGEEEGQYDDSIEEWLSGVETQAAKPYEALLSGEPPHDQARADFAVYLASQYARSPAMRRMYAEVHAAGAHAIMKVITETPERFEGQLKQFEAQEGPIEKHIRDRLYDFATNTSRYDLIVAREATLKALLVSDRLLKLFFKMGWQVLASDNQHLISSDSPVVRSSPNDMPGGGGFIHKKVEVTFPLSPTRCLLLSWKPDMPGLAPINRAIARGINVERAMHAERFLYADRLDSGIQKLGVKYKRTGLLMHFSGPIRPDELPKIEVDR